MCLFISPQWLFIFPLVNTLQHVSGLEYTATHDPYFEYKRYTLVMQVWAVAVACTTFVLFPDKRISDVQNFGRVHLCLATIGKCTSDSRFNFVRFCKVSTKVNLYNFYFCMTHCDSPVHMKHLFYLSLDLYQNCLVPISWHRCLVKICLISGLCPDILHFQLNT